MAIDTWKCSCGTTNTIQKEKCVSCNNSIPRRYLDKIMLGELMSARHSLDEKYQIELSERIAKQRSFFSKYSFVMAICCSCVFLTWVLIIGFSGDLRTNSITERLISSDSYLRSEVTVLTKQTSLVMGNGSKMLFNKSSDKNESVLSFHNAFLSSYNEVVHNLIASGEHINQAIDKYASGL